MSPRSIPFGSPGQELPVWQPQLSGRLRDLQDFGHLTGARPTSHQASATPHQCRG